MGIHVGMHVVIPRRSAAPLLTWDYGLSQWFYDNHRTHHLTQPAND